MDTVSKKPMKKNIKKKSKKSSKRSKQIMKARLILFALILIIAIIIVTIVVSISTKGKDPISSENFKTIMEENGYIVQDAIEQFANYDYIKSVYIAADKDLNYQIEFYVIEDDESAIQFFNNNKSIFEDSKGEVITETSADVKNCSRYTLNTNNLYKFISRINNTVVYINANDKYMNDLQTIIEKLNY